MIAITINGEPRRFRDPLNCKQLIDQLELAGKRVALERNGEIVPRSRFGDQQLADGDRLEPACSDWKAPCGGRASRSPGSSPYWSCWRSWHGARTTTSARNLFRQ